MFDAGHPQNPSNVTRLARALKPEDSQKNPQIVYYQSGVGTSWSLSDKWLGGGLAVGLSEHVREAYGFLVNNYLDAEGESEDDQIFMIGFSRGAYTARSVAGMVACLGLLTKSAMTYFYQVFEDFENAGDSTYVPKLPKYYPGFEVKVPVKNLNEYLQAYAAELRRHKLTREVRIKAVGVWDTVGSLGLPIQPWLQKVGMPTTLHSYRFFDTGVDDKIENAFHMMALDEHRSAFSPTVWSKKDGGKTHLKQVWMPGVHTTAGGGADDNGMCDLSLAWMMSQLKPFLDFNEDYLIEQVRATQKWYHSASPPWRWGLGILGNSMHFPTSMAGSITRTPLEYHVTDYSSGKALPKLLTNTGEKIHVSVRLRYQTGGKTYDNRPYTSDALSAWTMPKDDGLGKVKSWSKGGLLLEEDELGYFEKIILNLDPDAKLFLQDGN